MAKKGIPIEEVVEQHPSAWRSIPFAKARPDLAVQWYYKKNCGWGPEDFSYGSRVIAWWQCECNPKHIYDMQILGRSSNRSCPYCARKRVAPEYSLAKVFPELAKEWHPNKNGTLTPETIAAHSKKRVWWLCGKNKRHSWQVNVYARTNGNGCPICREERLLDLRDFPKLLKLFDKEKNSEINPYKLTTNTFVWWRCPKGPDHSWSRRWRKLGETLTCPFCLNQLPSITNRLDKFFPKVAKELHPTKNGKLKASEIPSRKRLRVWWQCSKNQRHIWNAIVRNRTVNMTGCPHCYKEKRSGE